MRGLCISVMLVCFVFGVRELSKPTETAMVTPTESPPPPSRVVVPLGGRATVPPSIQTTPTIPVSVLPEKETIVFRGTYRLAPGPRCGNAPFNPGVELEFPVIEVLKGCLPVKVVCVRRSLLGYAGWRPLENLECGTAYTLRLTPNEQTQGALRENPKVGGTEVWVSEAELAVIPPVDAAAD